MGQFWTPITPESGSILHADSHQGRELLVGDSLLSILSVVIQGGLMQATNNALPETGLVRLWQILGDRKKGIPPIIPVSKSTWWAGVKSGRYPKPIKLGARTTCWNVLDIRKLINQSGPSSD